MNHGQKPRVTKGIQTFCFILREITMLMRYAKALLVAAVAFDLSLVVFGNVTDYFINFAFVRGVMGMATTFKGNKEMWRSINVTWAYHAFYAIIILWEASAAIGCWVASARMLIRSKSASAFQASKDLAGAALTLALLLWFVAFTTVGGEWFLMWQSTVWNGLEPAFRMFCTTGIVLLILYVPENWTDSK
jgi:predicted small integral membrane protein